MTSCIYIENIIKTWPVGIKRIQICILITSTYYFGRNQGKVLNNRDELCISPVDSPCDSVCLYVNC